MPSRGAPPTADLLAMALFPQGSEQPGLAASEVALSAPLTAIRLHGISITPRRRAALISVSGGPAVWVAQGAEGPGFSVESVGRRMVRLNIAGATQELRLYADEVAGTPAAPAGAPASDGAAVYPAGEPVGG